MARIPETEIERLKTEVSVERLVEAAGIECPRRSKFEPPCRPNIEPGVEADFSRAGCG
ncbi:hypothetical protein [Acidovorax sp.]|uniref:hypothetical protein n=1 Tax=Acidovorax sp. TaxID=1872122 RepID=UPI00391F9FD8